MLATAPSREKQPTDVLHTHSDVRTNSASQKQQPQQQQKQQQQQQQQQQQ